MIFNWVSLRSEGWFLGAIRVLCTSPAPVGRDLFLLLATHVGCGLVGFYDFVQSIPAVLLSGFLASPLCQAFCGRCYCAFGKIRPVAAYCCCMCHIQYSKAASGRTENQYCQHPNLVHTCLLIYTHYSIYRPTNSVQYLTSRPLD